MKKSNKILLIISLCLMVLGILTVLVSFAVTGFSFIGYDVGVDYTKVDFEWTNEDFAKVKTIILTDVSHDLRIVTSQDSVLRFHAYNGQGYTYTAGAISQDGTLAIAGSIADRKWTEQLQVSFYPPDTTSVLELPAAFAGTVQVQLTSGDIDAYQVTSGAVWSLKTISGEVTLAQVTLAQPLHIATTSGEIDLTDITAKDMQLYSTSGDIELERITADTVNCKVTSGDVDIETVSAKTLICETVSGSVDFALFNIETMAQIQTTSGNIHLTIAAGENRYLIRATSMDGKVSHIFGGGSIPILLTSQSGSSHTDIDD